MFDFESTNWLASAVAALVTFVVGGPWYSNKMFLRPWMEDMNLPETKPGHPLVVFGSAYAYSYVACTTMSALLGPAADAVDGLILGSLVGIAFVAGSFAINYGFANRPKRALRIDAGFHVIQFTLFGLILGAWPT